MDFEHIIRVVKQFLPDVQAIYLYGSMATGTFNKESDLDVAILGSAPVSHEILINMQMQLFRDVEVEGVDLADISQCPLTLAIEILRSGRVLYGENSIFRARFEMRTLSAYALLNEERREILADIQKRGSIYAR